MCRIMNMMNGTANMISIFHPIVAVLSIQCSLALLSSPGNGTYDNLMFIEDDVQCLAEMPFGELMKIQKAIKMMHAVSADDAHRQTNLSAMKINIQSHNQSDSHLRELNEPVAETRTVFQFFKHTTTRSPLAEAFMMSGPFHDHSKSSQIIHKTGWASEWEEEKISKVQKVLHYSITALSFLAFAGYLLCMIVQAIKSKGTTYYHNNLSMVEVYSDNRFVTTKRRVVRPRFRRNAKAAERITIAEPDPMSMF